MKKTIKKTESRNRRHKKVRAKISGTSKRPRLAVFKSNKNLSAQIIDDEKGKTLFGVNTAKIDGKSFVEKVEKIAKEIAEKAKESKISNVVFDRGGFAYMGNIKVFADAVRKAGLKF